MRVVAWDMVVTLAEAKPPRFRSLSARPRSCGGFCVNASPLWLRQPSRVGHSLALPVFLVAFASLTGPSCSSERLGRWRGWSEMALMHTSAGRHVIATVDEPSYWRSQAWLEAGGPPDEDDHLAGSGSVAVYGLE